MDATIRKLERAALQGDSESLERLKVEWARTLTWRQCWLCESRVPAFRDSWKDHNENCTLVLAQRKREEEIERQRKESEAFKATLGPYVESNITVSQSALQPIVIPTPTGGIVAGRPRKEPLVLRSTDGFKTLRSNTEQQWDNWWYRCSLLPDITVPKKQLEALFNEGQLTFSLQSSVLFTLPCASIMAKPDSYWLNEVGDIPRYDVTISGKPLELFSQEAFRVSLNLEILYPLMFVLYGIWLRPLTS